MRLIDADALYEEHTRLAYKGDYAFHITARAWLENAPTVDAVPVVRCGKCKHWRRYGRDFVIEKDYGRCEKPDNESLIKYNASPYDDWYCADGERKGE